MKNKIKYIGILSILFIILVNCSKHKNKSFIKRIYEVLIDTTISETVFFENYYITLKSNGEFICINDKTFNVDTNLSNKLNSIKGDYFYYVFDTLIAGSKNNDYYLDNQFQWPPFKRLKQCYYKNDTTVVYDVYGNKYIDPLFFDDKYVITKFCYGEFGGTLYFYERISGKAYYCPATCATIVNKINDKYVITNSLAHMDGSSEIIEISNPKTLTEIDFDTLKYWANFWYLKIWDGHSIEKYNKSIEKLRGTGKQLLDTTGLLIHTTYKFENELYYIYSVSHGYRQDSIKNPDELYIGKVRNNKMETIDSIANYLIYSNEPKNRVYKDLILYSFVNHTNSGFISIKNDTINLIKYIRKH